MFQIVLQYSFQAADDRCCFDQAAAAGAGAAVAGAGAAAAAGATASGAAAAGGGADPRTSFPLWNTALSLVRGPVAKAVLCVSTKSALRERRSPIRPGQAFPI